MTWILMGAGLLMAVVAGVFLSFSDFIMRGLVQAPATSGAAGMIGLNRTVYRSVFMVLMMGLVPGSLVLAAFALWYLDGMAAVFVICGALSYLMGTVAVTGLGNVPMNTRLDALAEQPDHAAAYWPEYAFRWVRLNHLRTVAASTAALAWLSAAHML